MIRPTTLLALIILAGSAFGLFQVKYRVQALQKDLVEINRQLDEERSAMHVLKAEWAYLNQPDRLRALTGRHLHLNAIMANQLQEEMDVGKAVEVAEEVAPPIVKTAASEQPKPRISLKVATTQPKKAAKPQTLAKLEKPVSKQRRIAAKEPRKMERLANNLTPLYPTMEPLLSSLTVSQ